MIQDMLTEQLPVAAAADMSLLRRLGNWAFVSLVRLTHGGRYSDLCYGYNAFWARVLPQLNLDGDGFEIETIMNVRALRAGLKVVEVPSFESERRYGVSRLRTIPDGWRVLKALGKETWMSWRQGGRRRPASGRLPGQLQQTDGYAVTAVERVDLHEVV